MTPEEIIRTLGLSPHPEGGHYRETWRDVREDGTRGSGSAIYYLLCSGERSRRHRIDAVEIWHHYAGDPLELVVDGQAHVLGKDHLDGGQPQLIVPPHAWQSAHSLGDWTLAGCTVSPAFDFNHFEMDASDQGTGPDA